MNENLENLGYNFYQLFLCLVLFGISAALFGMASEHPSTSYATIAIIFEIIAIILGIVWIIVTIKKWWG